MRAEAELSLGHLDEAIADLEASKAVFDRIGAGWICTPPAVLGDVYLERGDLALARATLEHCLELAGGTRLGRAVRRGYLTDPELVTPTLTRAAASLARVLASDEPDLASQLAAFAVAQRAEPYHLDVLRADGWVAYARGDLAHAAERGAELVSEARRRSIESSSRTLRRRT